MWRVSVGYIIYRGIPVDRLSYFSILEKLNDFISEVARYFFINKYQLRWYHYREFCEQEKKLFLEVSSLIIFQEIKWQGQ